MTKEEAIQQMSEGKKVTHKHFSSIEWITINGNWFLFEDGVTYSQSEFWKYRTDESWDNNWEIFK